VVSQPSGEDDTPGYQLVASALLWKAGDGTRAYHDPIRVPRASELGGRTNPFFVEFYRGIAEDGKGLEAREHTAQVPPLIRQDREDAFREGRLPILYCSPTMELGVDIADQLQRTTHSAAAGQGGAGSRQSSFPTARTTARMTSISSAALPRWWRER
jgi:hypothetical protein